MKCFKNLKIDLINFLNLKKLYYNTHDIVIIFGVVGECISALGRENPFTDNLPGYDWLASFLKCHPEIISRVPELLKKSQAKSAANKRIFDEWFQLLKTTLEDNMLIDMPERVYNADESSFPLDP